MARYQDANNYYHWRVGNVNGACVAQLYKKCDGVFTKLHEVAVRISSTTNQNLKLVVNENVLTGYFNGQQVIQLSDNSFVNGYGGIRSYAILYDLTDIAITDLRMDALDVETVIENFTDTSLQTWQLKSGGWSVLQSESGNALCQEVLGGEALAYWGHPLWKNHKIAADIKINEWGDDAVLSSFMRKLVCSLR